MGRIESGTARVDTGTMPSILSLAGLRLAVLDQRECFESFCLAPCPCQCQPNPGSFDRFRLRHRTD